MTIKRVQINKVVQLNESNIKKLALLAKADGKKTDQQIAIWVIARSIYWKREGYESIIKEINTTMI